MYMCECAVHDDDLFLCTMYYTVGFVDYFFFFNDTATTEIYTNLRIAKEQGFISGGDMLVFENDTDQPRVITRNGLGNPDVNGFRNFVTLNGSLYVGTYSAANMGPPAGYAFYRLADHPSGTTEEKRPSRPTSDRTGRQQGRTR